MTLANLDSWALDREIVLVRVVGASALDVYTAWITPSRFATWFGPSGFSTSVRQMDVHVGGLAKFDMCAPAGTVFTNRFEYLELVPGERLVMDHGSDVDDAPDRFRVTVTIDQQDNGRSVVTLRQLHQTAEGRRQVISWGAVEMGMQTLAKLAEHCEVDAAAGATDDEWRALGLAAPARRALVNEGLTQLRQLRDQSVTHLSTLHGMGPKAMGALREAMRAAGLDFRE